MSDQAMGQHIYIIGSNSFSGSHCVQAALDRGYRVTGVSRSPEPDPVFLPYLNEDGSHPKGFSFIQADINHQIEEIITSVREDKPAYIINFAAQGMVAESWSKPEQWLRTNTLSQILLHDELRHLNWLKKYVQVSTPEVYGSTQGVVPESYNYRPSTPYAVSKAATDMSLLAFKQAYGFPVVFTRAANVYGPGQQLYRIIPRAVLRFLSGEVLELHGGGHSVRSFIHIRDVADATLRVMVGGEPGEVFHISTRRSISIRDLVHLIAQAIGVEIERHIRVVGDRLGKDTAYLLDTARIRAKLGWQDVISLEEGIEDVIAWIKGNFDTLESLPQDYIHKP